MLVLLLLLTGTGPVLTCIAPIALILRFMMILKPLLTGILLRIHVHAIVPSKLCRQGYAKTRFRVVLQHLVLVNHRSAETLANPFLATPSTPGIRTTRLNVPARADRYRKERLGSCNGISGKHRISLPWAACPMRFSFDQVGRASGTCC